MGKSWYKTWWAIVLIVLIVLILSIKIIGFIFFLYMNGDFDSSGTNQDSDNSWTQSVSSISAPLYLIHPQITSEGISLEIKNAGVKDLIVKKVFISSCGETNEEFIFPSKEDLTITVPCTLKDGDKFTGVIEIDYISADSTSVKTSSGGIGGSFAIVN